MALANFSRLSSALKMLPAKKGYNWALIIYARFELSRKNQSINCLILNELTHASLSYPILFPSFFFRPLAKSELSPSFLLLLPSILLPFFLILLLLSCYDLTLKKLSAAIFLSLSLSLPSTSSPK